MQGILVGLVAGVAAALLFVAPFSGTPPLAYPLFALTGVPIAIAGFGWGALAVAIAVVAGAAGVTAIDNWVGAVPFVLLFAVPIAWTTVVATQPRPERLDRGWWPIGIVLANAAAAVALGVIGLGVIIGFDPPTLVSQLTAAMVDLMANVNSDAGVPPLAAADIAPMARLYVALLPLSVGALGLAIVVLDLYLGAKSVRFSDGLKRPEEPMWSVQVPVLLPTMFVAAAVLAFVPGAVGYAAEAIAGALGAAVALVGLAVIHALSRRVSGRVGILAALYALTLPLSGLLIPLFALLGLAESVFHLRARRLTPRNPRST